MKKILVVSLSAGAGHVKTAEALVKTAELKYPNLECRHIDMYNYITYTFKKAAVTSYDLLAKNTPKLWGVLYDKTNDPKAVKRFNSLTKKLEQINSRKLYKEIQAFKPDVIISTHFLGTNVLLNQPKKYTYTAPVSTIITDYDLHDFWINPRTQNYFVATEKIKWKLLQRQATKKDDIIVSGIPVDPKFYKQTDKKEDISKTILLLSGGSGMVKTDEIVKELFKLKLDFNLITVAGKNKRLENKLKKLTPPQNIKYQAVGWTDKMDEFMKLADLVISKPGGLTTTECMVTGTPIIAIDPVPGQEEANVRFINENNLGWVAASYEDVVYYAGEFLKENLEYSPKAGGKTAADIILERLED